MRSFRTLACLVAALFLGAFGICFAESRIDPPTESEKLFLDRLMSAESGGRLTARNAATSAYGPFQFLSTTFLDVVQRNFPQLAADKSNAEILNLRADAVVARDAALVYTRENARFLAGNGEPVTAANLRLAFFVGPSGALKVLAAKPEEPLSNVLSVAALEANPVLSRMTAAGLIARATAEAQGIGSLFTGINSKGTRPKVDVRCNLKLASCRKWLALAERRMGRRHVVLAPESTEP
jgi:hypothetical protein